MTAESPVVHATEWVLVLADWQRANADVTIHLRGGGAVGPGKVAALPRSGLDSVVLHNRQVVTSEGRREVKWTIDPAEIAAVTAVAP